MQCVIPLENTKQHKSEGYKIEKKKYANEEKIKLATSTSKLPKLHLYFSTL